MTGTVSDLSIILTPEDMDRLITLLLRDKESFDNVEETGMNLTGKPWYLAGVLAEIEGAYPARVARRRKALAL